MGSEILYVFSVGSGTGILKRYLPIIKERIIFNQSVAMKLTQRKVHTDTYVIL
jgi:hypothetical protein